MYRVDVNLRVRRAVMVEGMSIRVTARTFGLHRDTVRKMLAYSAPPGGWRRTGWGGVNVRAPGRLVQLRDVSPGYCSFAGSWGPVHSA